MGGNPSLTDQKEEGISVVRQLFWRLPGTMCYCKYQDCEIRIELCQDVTNTCQQPFWARLKRGMPKTFAETTANNILLQFDNILLQFDKLTYFRRHFLANLFIPFIKKD